MHLPASNEELLSGSGTASESTFLLIQEDSPLSRGALCSFTIPSTLLVCELKKSEGAHQSTSGQSSMGMRKISSVVIG